MWQRIASLWRRHGSTASQPAPGGQRPQPCVERRLATRYVSDVPVLCHPASAPEETRVPAHVRDVSANGIALLSEERFEPGTLLEVERPGPNNHPRLRMVSCVRHVSGQDGKPWMLGCSFIRELSDQELQAFL
jgi:PilZ domain